MRTRGHGLPAGKTLKRTNDGHGYLCPTCRSSTTVYNSRPREDGRIRRNRACIGCGLRFTTVEIPLDEVTRDLVPLAKRLRQIADELDKPATEEQPGIIIPFQGRVS